MRQIGTIGELFVNVRQALAEAEVSDATTEAELLVRETLGMSAATMWASLREPVPEGASQQLAAAVERRLSREPLAYILGWREFYGRRFEVDRRVLIPRPETELLVDLALHFIDERRTERPARLADIGTGSGILAITLALELPEAAVQAVELSAEALEVARANSRRYNVDDRITWHRGHLAEPVEGPVDVLVANLPYVLSASLPGLQPEMAFEPKDALDGGPDGMRFIAPLLAELPAVLAPVGALALIEIDPPLVDAVARQVRSTLPQAHMRIVDDPAGLARCAEIRTPVAVAPIC